MVNAALKKIAENPNLAYADPQLTVDAAKVILPPVHAEGATGRNKLPILPTEGISERDNLSVSNELIQTNGARYIGARPMERLIVRSIFAGDVRPGGRYVLVDDTTVTGSTLADLANYI